MGSWDVKADRASATQYKPVDHAQSVSRDMTDGEHYSSGLTDVGEFAAVSRLDDRHFDRTGVREMNCK